MNLLAPDRTWHFPRKMTADLLVFAVLGWIGFLVVVAMVDIGFNPTGGAWEPASQLIPWFVLFMGVHVGGTLLPINIAHGTTRRDFTIESIYFLIAYSLGIALLSTLGWVFERVLFSFWDGSQSLSEDHLFSSPTDYPRIFTESFLLILGWTASGLFMAVAVYRHKNEGLIAIAPCIVLIGIMQAAIGSSWGPAAGLIDRFFDLDRPPLLAALVIGVMAIAGIMALAWLIIRDMPLRTTSA